MDMDNGKAPMNGASGLRKGGSPGAAQTGLINVQPPRREDLQPAYAQLLHGDDDASSHGWYGAMSMFRHHALYKMSETNED